METQKQIKEGLELKYKGHLITLKKKYKFISTDYPASQYIEGSIDGRIVADGFTKKEILSILKNKIRKDFQNN